MENYQLPINIINIKSIMNFSKVFLIVVICLVLLAGHGDAKPGWLKKIGKKLERVGQNTFKATEKVVGLGVQAAGAVNTVKSGWILFWFL